MRHSLRQTATTVAKPILSLRAPHPCAPRLVAEEYLGELGNPVGSERRPEARAWRTK